MYALRFTAVAVFLFATLAIASFPSSVRAVSFQGLGNVPPGFADRSLARGVSADGKVVVGFMDDHVSYNQAFRWTVTDGLVGLGDLPGGRDYGAANAASADGSVVVGNSDSASALHYEAYRWTASEGMVGLGVKPAENSKSSASGVSADGSVVVGTGEYDYAPSSYGFTREAFRWTSDEGLVWLGDLPGGDFYSRANGISADGSVIVGEGMNESGTTAYRWTSSEGMVDIGRLPGSFYSTATAVSADGEVVIGFSATGGLLNGEAFRWTASEGMVGLGFLPGFDSSAAGAVSADGSVIVGQSSQSNGFPRIYDAFVWDQIHGMRSLQDILIAGGVDLTGWTELTSASGVSADGRIVVGYGRHNGNQEAFIAEIPEPATLGLFGVGGLLVTGRRRVCISS